MSSPISEPATPLQFSMEQSDSQPTPDECAEIVLTDEESVEGKVISLAAKAKKDAKLTAGWSDHSSDEDEYENKENDEPDEEEEESSDSEAPDAFHEQCVSKAAEMFDTLELQGWKAASKKREAKAALAGVLEDFKC